MVKTLREIIPEVYEPKPEDEKRFKEKHGFDPKDRSWPMFKNIYSEKTYDKLFKGINVKTIKRAAERHGYDPKDDESYYE